MKKKIERFEDLIAWQKARALVAAIYKPTQKRPFARDFAFCNQITKAALSVPSNIAEGFERDRLREFHQFLSVAKSSCAEVRSQLYSAYDLGYVSEAELNRLLRQGEEVGRIIGGLRRSVEREFLRTQDSGLRTEKSVH
jgi:four helix bundle protein